MRTAPGGRGTLAIQVPSTSAGAKRTCGESKAYSRSWWRSSNAWQVPEFDSIFVVDDCQAMTVGRETANAVVGIAGKGQQGAARQRLVDADQVFQSLVPEFRVFG